MLYSFSLFDWKVHGKGFGEAISTSEPKRRAILCIRGHNLMAELTRYRNNNQYLLITYCMPDTITIHSLSQAIQQLYLLCTIIISISQRKWRFNVVKQYPNHKTCKRQNQDLNTSSSLFSDSLHHIAFIIFNIWTQLLIVTKKRCSLKKVMFRQRYDQSWENIKIAIYLGLSLPPLRNYLLFILCM